VVPPSALPPWLPDDIVDCLNATFGGQLRQEIVKIMKTVSIRGRINSAGSERLPVDSLNRGPSFPIFPMHAFEDYEDSE
jgi:hypothetical protein